MSDAKTCLIGLAIIAAIVILKEIVTRMGDKKKKKK